MLALRLENFLYFPASALYFQETNFFLYLRKGICPGITELSYISGNKAFSYSSLIFQDVTFRARKMKKPTIIFQEMELSNSKIKKLLTFQERTCKPENQKFLTFLLKHENKRKRFLYFSL